MRTVFVFTYSTLIQYLIAILIRSVCKLCVCVVCGFQCSSLGLAFAPQVKFVMKRKGQAAAKSTGAVSASRSKEIVHDKTDPATESDAESSADSVTSSDDEQKTGSRTEHEKMTGVANASNYESDEDGELLLKKTIKSEKLIELKDSDAEHQQAQVLHVMSV